MANDEERFPLVPPDGNGHHPTIDIAHLFNEMERSGAGVMQMKLFRRRNDERAFRMVVLVDGEDEVGDVAQLLDELAARWEEERDKRG